MLRTLERTKLTGMATLFVVGLSACAAQTPKASTAPTSSSDKLLAKRTETQTSAPGSSQDCSVSAVYFGHDGFELDGPARDTLEKSYACTRKQGAKQLRVTGMTDPQGTEEYNMALGDRRAKAAARYLSALGAQATETVSLGEEMAQGGDADSWSRDRRVELQGK